MRGSVVIQVEDVLKGSEVTNAENQVFLNKPAALEGSCCYKDRHYKVNRWSALKLFLYLAVWVIVCQDAVLFARFSWVARCHASTALDVFRFTSGGVESTPTHPSDHPPMTSAGWSSAWTYTSQTSKLAGYCESCIMVVCMNRLRADTKDRMPSSIHVIIKSAIWSNYECLCYYFIYETVENSLPPHRTRSTTLPS